MGSNALTVATPGQDIPASHHNELVQALLQNIVPRNANRTAQDLAGQIGESGLRFLRAYVETYHIGTASANLRIQETSPGEIHILRDVDKEKIILKNGTFEFYINNSLVMAFNPGGMNCADRYIDKSKISNNGNIWQGDVNLPSRSDYGAVVQIGGTLSNCVAGKKIYLLMHGWTDNGQGLDNQIFINGSQVDSQTGPGNYYFEYTIPANGNYTFSAQYRDGGFDGYVRIEEV